jgi:glutaredoxin
VGPNGYRKLAKMKMTTHVLFFTQPGCLSCELMRIFLEAKEIVFEERDITTDLEARRAMTEQYESAETPTLVIFFGEREEVVVGFDPVRLDRFLDSAPSSDSVTES